MSIDRNSFLMPYKNRYFTSLCIPPFPSLLYRTPWHTCPLSFSNKLENTSLTGNENTAVAIREIRRIFERPSSNQMCQICEIYKHNTPSHISPPTIVFTLIHALLIRRILNNKAIEILSKNIYKGFGARIRFPLSYL